MQSTEALCSLVLIWYIPFVFEGAGIKRRCQMQVQFVRRRIPSLNGDVT